MFTMYLLDHNLDGLASQDHVGSRQSLEEEEPLFSAVEDEAADDAAARFSIVSLLETASFPD